MKKNIGMAVFGAGVLATTIVPSFTVSALTMTITESTNAESGLSVIEDNTLVMGVTKFTPGVVVTAGRALQAGVDDAIFNYLNQSYKSPSIYYYLSGNWYVIDMDSNAVPVEEAILSQLERIDIYYVNNEEKMLEISYDAELAGGEELVFKTDNAAKDSKVRYEEGKISVPALVNKVEVYVKNTETNTETLVERFEKDAVNAVEFENKTTANVATLDEFKAALSNKELLRINITEDITGINETLNAANTVTINGGGHTLKFESLEKTNGVASGLVVSAADTEVNDLKIEFPGTELWDGHYALQVYNTTGVVISNYTATGADAALLANGAEVEIKGTMTVSGNEFGGIEVSRGSAVERDGKLTVSGTIVMDDEELTRPAIWVENGQGTVVATGLTEKDMTAFGKDQTFYFANAENMSKVSVGTLDLLKVALADPTIKEITLTADIENINETLTAVNTVTINGNGHTLTFGDLPRVGGSASGLVITGDGSRVDNLKIVFPGAEGWSGHYALQVYGAEGVTISNFTGTGADAALMANSSEVKVEGTIVVSGNEFGGIEVSQSSNPDMPKSTFTVAGNIVMDDEELTHPAIWLENGQGTVVAEGFGEREMNDFGKDQTFYFANPESAGKVSVGDLDSLKIALELDEIKEINLTADIKDINETLTAANTVSIDGGNHTLTFGNLAKNTAGTASGLVITGDGSRVDNLKIVFPGTEGWLGHYALQVYNTTGVVISNYTATGADAALLVNGSEVELVGTTTVSGNEFGGIEVSRGSAVERDGKLTVSGTITMTDESATRPALWTEDAEEKKGTIAGRSFATKKIEDKNQTYYFLNAELAE